MSYNLTLVSRCEHLFLPSPLSPRPPPPSPPSPLSRRSSASSSLLLLLMVLFPRPSSLPLVIVLSSLVSPPPLFIHPLLLILPLPLLHPMSSSFLYSFSLSSPLFSSINLSLFYVFFPTCLSTLFTISVFLILLSFSINPLSSILYPFIFYSIH